MELKGRYGVIEETNTVTGATQWSVGKWIKRFVTVEDARSYEKTQSCLVSIGFEGDIDAMDWFRKDLHPNRLTYRLFDVAEAKVIALNEEVDKTRTNKAWVRKTEI